VLSHQPKQRGWGCQRRNTVGISPKATVSSRQSPIVGDVDVNGARLGELPHIDELQADAVLNTGVFGAISDLGFIDATVIR
jgi:hypothetical protein